MLSGKGQRKVAVNEKAEEHTCMLVRWMFVMCHTGPIPSGLKMCGGVKLGQPRATVKSALISISSRYR